MLGNDIQDWMAAKFVKRSKDPLACINDVLVELVKPGVAQELIHGVLNDTDLLRKSALASYAHRNGFDKIVLLSGKNPEFKLRAHIWWPDEAVKRERGDVHNHRWDLGSALLKGSYIFEEFLSGTGSETLNEYRYRSPAGGATFGMEYVGPTSVTCSFRGVMNQGMLYVLKHDVLHRVWTDREHPTVSLVVQGPTRVSYTTVLSETETGEQVEVQVAYLSERAVSAKLHSVLELFGS